ncbi:MAG: hypothetical protein HY900_16860 [Deltaproteobacteria bacterium]|nr:hypothetical protein [Deltaproteobacteria bacterium]
MSSCRFRAAGAVGPLRAGAAVLAGLLLLSPGAGRAEPIDAVVARVGRDVVTRSGVLQEERIGRWDPSEPVRAPLVTVAAALVRRRLFASEAEKLNLAPTPAEVLRSVDALAVARGDPAGFWGDMAAVGVTENDLRRRARELLLMRRYLDVRKGMAFVPERELRAFLREQAGVLGQEPAPEVQDAVRAYLTERKHRQELKRWLDRQVADGRVQLLDGAGETGGGQLGGKMPGQRFSPDDTVPVSFLLMGPECTN